ncbi:MAG: prepilin-type N-terminal cleavage/methylation domain-containing protein [bacterium]|nr:prepilin-type N-terminal cleavage/methylation domain-containing protein [bacterium]
MKKYKNSKFQIQKLGSPSTTFTKDNSINDMRSGSFANKLLTNMPSKSGAGFTLIETLIYISIFAMVGGLLVNILVDSLKLNTEGQSTRAVTEEGRFVVETVKRLVRESSLIDMSTTTPQGTLILRMNDSTKRDFVHVYASGTKIYMAEGVIGNDGASSTPCSSIIAPVCALNALTDDKVSVNSLSFRRFSNAPGNDTLQIDFTLSYNTSATSSKFSKAFQTGIARVSAAVFDSDLIPNGSKSIGVSGQKWLDGYFSGDLNVGRSIIAGGSNLFKVDSTNNKIGIGTSNPLKKLHISGGDVYIDGNGKLIFYATSTCYSLSFNENGSFSTSSVSCL